MANNSAEPWGRVDETGTVYVREEAGERAVGQYPDATPAEALAYYERKYQDLVGQVILLEQRVRRGGSTADIAKTVATLRERIVGANAVGDLAGLAERLGKLDGTVNELTEKEQAEHKAALEDTIATRTKIVEQAEALAAQDPAKIQWKETSAKLDALFADWQKEQQNAPRIAKSEANRLWDRFKTARSTLEQWRRAFFAELDSQNKEVRERKQKLIDQAEALASKGSDGIPEYRTLLDKWKQSGRAGKRYDDALWAKFKAAGDVLYSAKSESDAIENVEFEANLEAKLAILTEAEPLLKATDRVAAKSTLRDIQRRWDEIGKVPRAQMKSVEDRLRAVETAVRKLDEDHWEKTNPEKQARSEGLAGQLEAAIEKLEAELADAKSSGDKAKVTEAEEAISARKMWLAALGK